MLVDTVKKYYDKEYDLNCAETIIYAANEEYGLNLGLGVVIVLLSIAFFITSRIRF